MSVLGTLIDVLSAALLAAGGFFYLVGAIGLNRMPDVFTRLHATSVSETLGLGLLFAGMALQAGFTLVLVKLLVIFALVALTAPIATHALARAALHDGNRPLLAKAGDGEGDGALEETDLVTIYPELAERIESPTRSESMTLPGSGKEASPSNS